MIAPATDCKPLHDVKGVYDELQRRGLVGRLRALQTPSTVRSLLALAFDWGCILLAWALVSRLSAWLAPLAVFLIGSRQRALGNLLHEAGHKMLFPSRRWNDRLANLFVGIPTFSPVRLYRLQHSRHHAHLGIPGTDPDFIHAEEDLHGTAWELFRRHAFDREMFRINTVSGLRSMSRRERAQAAAWWAVLLGALGLGAGPAGAFSFAALWAASRATVFHSITVFREISDHVGLEPGSVLGFTRNSPHEPLLSFFLHPHRNNYHLTHHLAPTVPFHRLHEAHEIFMAVPDYARAHQCDRYFKGQRSVVACWVRRCLSWHRAAERQEVV